MNGENILVNYKSFTKRVSANIMDRINYYIIVRKYIDYIKKNFKNNYIHTYKIINNQTLLSIGKNIILEKKLGTGGYGVVYKAYFRLNSVKYRKLGKMFKMVVKICEITDKNKKEIEILTKLTALILKMVCPHFPISYGYLICNKKNEKVYSKISSAISSYDRISSIKINPRFFSFRSKSNLYLIVNEYANNTFPYMLEYIFKKYELNVASFILNNMIIQCLISIIFFQKYIKMVHYDTHIYNFLVHYIKEGGYYHYNIYGKNYYLKNTGYLIVINDFGLAKPINKNLIKRDFKMFLLSLNKRLIKRNIEFISQDLVNFLKNISLNKKYLYKYLFDFMHKYFPNNLITSKPSNIINKKPFIIS